jgi:hypothetical protein
MGKVNLDDYVEVHERIEAFYVKYPDGSLQSSWDLVDTAEGQMIVVRACAYRTPDDPRPGVGLASEPLPGLTPYTKHSELANGETSAWGRAIAALGFEVKRGIASANEVRNRQSEDKPKESKAADLASTQQKGAITRRCKELEITDEHKPSLLIWAGGDPLTKGKAGRLITLLKTAKSFDEVWESASSEHWLRRPRLHRAGRPWRGALHPAQVAARRGGLPRLLRNLRHRGGP